MEVFLDRYWDLYDKLCEFRIKPDSKVAEQLSIKFDQLFSTKTGYEQPMKELVKRKITRNSC